jgi:hypothetical protein
MYGGAVDDASVIERKSGGVIWALNAVIHQFAFREWSAKVGTCFGQGEDALSSTNQQNGDTIVHGASWPAFDQFRVSQDGHEVFGEDLAVGAINAHSVLVDHFSAEMG